MSFESFLQGQQGLSGREKKQRRLDERKAKLELAKERSRRGENYGDIKVSRRIPGTVADAVRERDAGRDFGRPNHICQRPGPPHHIIHFEKFLRGEVCGNPHTPENLEAPCGDCHTLAHAMKIPSGVSIETFFRNSFGTNHN